MKNYLLCLVAITLTILLGCDQVDPIIYAGTAPSAQTLSLPNNGATNQSISPTLSWNASTGASSYTLQISTDSLFVSYAYNQDGLTDTSRQISGLNNSTKYYWRVSATNSYGTSGWSSVWNFTTATMNIPCPGTPTVFYSGKTYNTVQIGSQCWLRENLDVGKMIAGVDTQKNNGIIEKYCYYDSIENCNAYGGLYQWNEAIQYSTTPGSQGICPTGWHLPTKEEFLTLRTAVGGDGNALKAIGQGIGPGSGTNTSGFSALLSGYRDYYGYFSNLGLYANFWSSSEYSSYYAYLMYLYYDGSNISYFYTIKYYCFSVRCLKD